MHDTDRPWTEQPWTEQPWTEQPWTDGPRREEERLAHLVLLDGRLVDTWTEPVAGSRWEHQARRLERAFARAVREAAQPPAPPPPAPWEVALDWLGSVCGGAGAVAALDAEPLVEDGLDLPEVVESHRRERLEATAALLDAVAARCFDPETSFALRRALLLVWRDDPHQVIAARSAAHLAGGVCWAVAKGNALFRPQGAVATSSVQEALGTTSLTSAGQRIAATLRGFHARRWGGHAPPGVPALEPLGHADLLLGVTRERLLRLRARAWEARDAAAA